MSLQIHLPQDVQRRLSKLSERSGRSLSYLIAEAVREHLDDLEDLYIARQRLSALRSGAIPALPFEDVLKRHDRDN